MEKRRLEARKHRIWEVRVKYLTAFVIFLLILFSLKLFNVSPLDGAWHLKGSQLRLNVKGNKRMEAVVRTNVVDGDATVRLSYKLDKENHIITIEADESDIAAAAKGSMTKEGLKTEISPLMGTFTYRVKKDKMTLEDTDSKEKLTFVKK